MLEAKPPPTNNPVKLVVCWPNAPGYAGMDVYYGLTPDGKIAMTDVVDGAYLFDNLDAAEDIARTYPTIGDGYDRAVIKRVTLEIHVVLRTV